ncbi:GNAT family N-acetyltransferase [Fusibacter bizertensis]|uniref:GNAT family N-acetyltransferase n=1 Tax=Fusibacter bizertensis TaxID=1488331 RepID=A0ABT6N8V0_9FIRM|nr:GNAT family N-acetyltransferase [Fusibacter bizertensis]MDH8676833.1 GNAT family N-acetyltransferase [Fusibacter bizertensis]
MNSEIKIYKASEQHIEALVKICLSNVDLYEPIMPGAFQKYAGSISQNGIPKTYDVMMIEYKCEVVGFVGTIELKDGIVYLMALYLQREYQGKGIGKIVMNKLKDYFQKKGNNEIVLLAHKDAKWAISFYEIQGFNFISRLEMVIKGYANTQLEKHYITSTVLYSLMLGIN